VLVFAPSASAIIGGTPAAPNTWSWNARLEISTPSHDEVCSGSVVAPSVILTAGHCVVDDVTNTVDAPSDLVVTTGRTTFADPASGQVLGVTHVALYPSFSLSTVRGDVALLELASPTSSQAISLAQPSDTAAYGPGAGTIVAGWGLVDATEDTLPTQLMTVPLTVQTNSLCESSLADVTLGFDPSTMFCAESSDQSAGTCNGDSGGPAVGLNAAGALIEIGVVSWNREGCVHPDVFARVAALSAWLGPTIAALQADATPPVAAPVVTPPVVTSPASVPVPVPVAIAGPVASGGSSKVATAEKTAKRLALHIHPVTATAGGIAQLRFWAALPGAKIVAHARVVENGAVIFSGSTRAFTPDGKARSIAFHVPRSLRRSVRFCMYATSRAISSAHVCATLEIRAARARS
jgi:hypothetical protein